MDQSLSSPVPLPPVEEQRRIADFLDDQVARIDQVMSDRTRQREVLSQQFISRVIQLVGGGTTSPNVMPMSPEWLSQLPATWLIQPIGVSYDVKLGKMLSQERSHGRNLAPYLRNANVQWDRIDTEDLELMDFPPEDWERYQLKPGDLLICEGGQPGRAAVWLGGDTPMFYQKALHRARPRGDHNPRWLLYCLRAAVAANYFAVDGNTTTIAHLTGEQLSATRFPFPSGEEQRALVSELDALHDSLHMSETAIDSSLALLEERKRAVITAAVTGELNVTTAQPIGVGKWVPNVGASVEGAVAAQAQAPSIGEIG